MNRNSIIALCATAVVGAPLPALAQRANENVIRAAEDAFGTSVGNESLGLYNAGQIRSFNPSVAGNVRMDGLYFDALGTLSGRLISGSRVRVGLSAQTYPFPAPTGIVDYQLRQAGDRRIVSTVVTAGPLGTKALEVDAQLPIRPRTLSLVTGFMVRHNEGLPGDVDDQLSFAFAPIWRPTPKLEIRPFFTRGEKNNDNPTTLVFSAGGYAPPLKAKRNLAPDWADDYDTHSTVFGLMTRAAPSEAWLVRTGLFHWIYTETGNMSDQYTGAAPDGLAQHFVSADPSTRATSTSGEGRLTRIFVEGPRRQALTLNFRGRDLNRRYGGTDRIGLGPAFIGQDNPVPRPGFVERAQSFDHLTQTSFGLSYEGLWRNLGELGLGLQKTSFRKSVTKPGATPVITRDDPWLYNGTIAAYLSSKAAIFAGYTRGLEESGSAPDIAVNKSEAPPPVGTSQWDAGLRVQINPATKLVISGFEISKPYFNIDPSRVYRNLGEQRRRGLELSLTGRLSPRATYVAGAVLLDPVVRGDAVRLGLIGKRPIGLSKLSGRFSLDYQLPTKARWSVDVGVNYASARTASGAPFAALGGKQLELPARTLVDLGARYRFTVSKHPASLRFQLLNVGDSRGWEVTGSGGFYPASPRRLGMVAALDF